MRVRQPWLLRAVLALVLLGLTQPPGAQAALPRLTIGIVPQLPAWTLARRWTPVLDAWSRAAHVRLVFRTAPTIAIFERRVAAGRYSLVYLNPGDYVRYRNRYRAFGREAGWLRGILVARKEGHVRTLADLSGQTLAFPARNALAASVQPRQMLASRHIPFDVRYVGSHASVYLGVIDGLFPAGGGVQQTLALAPMSVRGQLKVLWRGPRTLPHPFAARRSLPPRLVRRLTAALVGLTASAGPALRRLGFTGFVAASDREYYRCHSGPQP